MGRYSGNLRAVRSHVDLASQPGPWIVPLIRIPGLLLANSGHITAESDALDKDMIEPAYPDLPPGVSVTAEEKSVNF